MRLQALIAAEHARGADAVTTDWRAIAQWYGQLEALTGSAVVRLNRAVAVAEAVDAAAGLELLVGLDDALGASHRLPAVRADLARRAGDLPLARASYREAIGRCPNEVERTYLSERLEELASPHRVTSGRPCR